MNTTKEQRRFPWPAGTFECRDHGAVNCHWLPEITAVRVLESMESLSVHSQSYTKARTMELWMLKLLRLGSTRQHPGGTGLMEDGLIGSWTMELDNGVRQWSWTMELDNGVGQWTIFESGFINQNFIYDVVPFFSVKNKGV